MITPEMLFDRARWISNSDTSPGKPIAIDTPSLRARRCFTLESLPECAVASVSGLGAFVMYVNGERVGNDFLSPAFTNCNETVLYCEYDITSLLRVGKNTLCIEVGAGYFNQATYDRWSFAHSPWRDFEKLLFVLRADGEEILVSDKSWRVTKKGPRTHTQIRQGEFYDARLEDGWLLGDFDDSSWDKASLTRIPGGELKKMILPPIRVCKRLAPIASFACPGGVIYDFGDNISGRVRAVVSGERGQVLTVKYGERIIDGELDEYMNRWGVKNEAYHSLEFGDRYTLRGDGSEVWSPEFVYYGFRYIFLSDNCQVESVEAEFLRTDFAERGGFSSSSDRYSWLVSAGLNGFLSNFHGFSEDCPHREKNGWTGDASISVDHAVYRYDMIESYRKWLGDITDAQLKSGQLPAIAPTGIYGYTWGSGPAWDHTLFYIPWVVYRDTGDDSLFDGVIDAGVKYFKYAKKYEDEDGIVKFGLSDWCAPLPVAAEEVDELCTGRFDPTGRKRMTVATNHFSDSCYHYKNLSMFADALKRRGDSRAEEYRLHAEKVLSGIRRRYLKDGTVDNDTQSALALALFFGIAEGEMGKALAARLADKVQAGNYKMECGILGTKALFNSLADYGYLDLCHKMLTIEDYPSYGFWHKNGLRTFPELWEVADGSRNHHMYSDIVSFVYKNIGGVQNKGIAYDVCRIAPYIFAEECSASTYTETPRGRIAVDWSYRDGRFNAEILIPSGTSACLEVMNKKIALTVGVNKITL